MVLFEAGEDGNSSQTGTECVGPGEELPEVQNTFTNSFQAT